MIGERNVESKQFRPKGCSIRHRHLWVCLHSDRSQEEKDRDCEEKPSEEGKKKEQKIIDLG